VTKLVCGSDDCQRKPSTCGVLLRLPWTLARAVRPTLGALQWPRTRVPVLEHMASDPSTSAVPQSSSRPVAKVLVATTAMLAFISYWRAAAIVLNDLASSAYYAGGEAEQFIGKTAPWFILATMFLSYAVSQLYVESCSMFVRGGVYRVVKEAMGGALAKFSVSALMFDYILTGPISAVAAGQYLAGLLNELLAYAHVHGVLRASATAEIFAVLATLYFWWENIRASPNQARKRFGSCSSPPSWLLLSLVGAAIRCSREAGTCPPRRPREIL